jgi:hypothetical protein
MFHWMLRTWNSAMPWCLQVATCPIISIPPDGERRDEREDQVGSPLLGSLKTKTSKRRDS